MSDGAYLLLFVFIGGPLLIWAMCWMQKQPEPSIFHSDLQGGTEGMTGSKALLGSSRSCDGHERPETPCIIFGGSVADYGVGTASAKPQAHPMDGESANPPAIQNTCPKGVATTNSITSKQYADARENCWKEINRRMKQERTN